MKLFLNKIPRARLYLSNSWLLRNAPAVFLTPIRRAAAVEATERKLAAYFDSKHCVTLSSCRMAFYFVLKSMGLSIGDEVLLTPMTIPDMVNAIHVLGLKPVFVDMSLDAQNIDVNDLKRKITAKSRVLLITHLSGLVPDLDSILSLASAHRIRVVEDVSQNQGALYKGKKLGTFGEAAVATTSISKTISSLWGGFVLTQRDDLFDLVKKRMQEELALPKRGFLIKHFFDNVKVNLATQRVLFSFVTYYAFKTILFLMPGKLFSLQEKARSDGKFFENPRLLRSQMPADAMMHFSDVQARILDYSLDRNAAVTQRRRVLAKAFLSVLSERARLFLPTGISQERQDRLATYWHLPIMLPALREEFQVFLFKNNVDTTGYGLAVCSQEPAFERYKQNTPVARFIKNATVFIPMHDSFSEFQMETMARLTNSFVDEHWAKLSASLPEPTLERDAVSVH